MNSIELQLWGNAEAKMCKQLEGDIAWRKADLEFRQEFIDVLNERLGVFFGDLVTGPVYKHDESTLVWRLPIAFNGVTGYIESRDSGTLVIKIGTAMCDINRYGLKSQSEIADWLERCTK
jgi:hypothetical protein